VNNPLGRLNVTDQLEDSPALTPVVLSVAGELDLATARDLRRRLEQHRDTPTEIVVDLDAVTFIDCAGLRPLLEARATFGDRLFLQSVPPRVSRLLTLLKLEHSLPVIDARTPGSPQTRVPMSP
jgi:anti-anti-sigma factor